VIVNRGSDGESILEQIEDGLYLRPFENADAKPVMRRCSLLVLLVAGLAGCGAVVRVAYNNSDVALRMMADDYFDLDGAQTELFRTRFARFHDWHRREELPQYAALFGGAAGRLAQGLAAEDVTWAIAALRTRYRVLVAQAVDEAAPIAATFRPENYAALERKLAANNAKFAKTYSLASDQAKRDEARVELLEKRFASFIGKLSPEQRELLVRSVQSQPRLSEARLKDRVRRQEEFVALLKEHRDSPHLAERIREFFVHWERDRGAEYAKLAREWEERLVQLLLDMDRTLSAEQRARAVERFERYAEDFRSLAREGQRPSEARAGLAFEPVR
jgi:Family of unknown function (DUF6279)